MFFCFGSIKSPTYPKSLLLISFTVVCMSNCFTICNYLQLNIFSRSLSLDFVPFVLSLAPLWFSSYRVTSILFTPNSCYLLSVSFESNYLVWHDCAFWPLQLLLIRSMDALCTWMFLFSMFMCIVKNPLTLKILLFFNWERYCSYNVCNDYETAIFVS